MTASFIKLVQWPSLVLIFILASVINIMKYIHDQPAANNNINVHNIVRQHNMINDRTCQIILIILNIIIRKPELYFQHRENLSGLVQSKRFVRNCIPHIH